MITKEDFDEAIDLDGSVIVASGGIENWLRENEIEPEAFISICERLAIGMHQGMVSAKEAAFRDGEDDDWVSVAVAAGMGVAFIAGWSCHKKLGTKPESVWPMDDVTATGVIDTIAARRDTESIQVVLKARWHGPLKFNEALQDHEGWVEDYFYALVDDGEVEHIDYDRYVGPAVDRIEDLLYPQS